LCGYALGRGFSVPCVTLPVSVRVRNIRIRVVRCRRECRRRWGRCTDPAEAGPLVHGEQVSRRVADRTGDLAAASKDIVDRLRIIYNESRKVVDEATELWSQGRKLAGV
jgi:hypothetical protein